MQCRGCRRKDKAPGATVREVGIVSGQTTLPIAYTVVDRPSVPVIWLDTHVVSTFCSAQERRGQDSTADLTRFDRMVALVRAGRLVVPETDQLEEIRLRPSLVDSAVSVLVALGGSVERASRHDVRRSQERAGMSAFLAGEQSTDLPWRDVFAEVEQADSPITVRVTATSESDNESKRKRKRIVARDWESIRLAASKFPGRQDARFLRQLNDERLGMADVFDRWLEAAYSVQEAEPEGALDAHYAVSSRMDDWRASGGAGLFALRDFYLSQHYCALPHVQIGTELRARQMVIGQTVRSGDNMDLLHVATVLPYADLMVVDRATIDAVNQLKLGERFGCQLGKLSDVDRFLDQVEAGRWIRHSTASGGVDTPPPDAP